MIREPSSSVTELGSRSAHGQIRGDLAADVVGDHVGCVDAPSQSTSHIFFNAEWDQPAAVYPSAHARKRRVIALAGLRLQDLAMHAVHVLGTDNGLGLPGKVVVHQIFVEDIASE